MDRVAAAPQRLPLEALPAPPINPQEAIQPPLSDVPRRRLGKLQTVGVVAASAVALAACADPAPDREPLDLPFVAAGEPASTEAPEAPEVWGDLDEYWPPQNLTPEAINMGTPVEDSTIADLCDKFQSDPDLSITLTSGLNITDPNATIKSTPAYWTPPEGGPERAVCVVTGGSEAGEILVMAEDLSSADKTLQDHNNRLRQIAERLGDWTEHQYEDSDLYTIIGLRDGGFDILVFPDRYKTDSVVLRIIGSTPHCSVATPEGCRVALETFIQSMHEYGGLGETLTKQGN